jgi:hypothetical protein
MTTGPGFCRGYAFLWAQPSGEWNLTDMLQAFISACRPLAAAELATAAQVVSFIEGRRTAVAQGVF